ncbi:MAG: nucleotidyltransferase family protein [Bacteroidetes bacterium]|nr:nucleotidyltransferase family protein [Bacteroidota bacterium]
MLLLPQIQSTLAESLPALKRKYPIASLALFGSVTRDDFDPIKSDIDIMVSFDSSIGIGFIDLADELEQLLGREVDLISMESLKPRQWEYLKNQIVYV